MDDTVRLVEDEVVEQRPVRREGLRADPGRAGQHVVDLQLGQQLPRRGDEEPGRQVARRLRRTRAPVPAGQAAKPLRAQRVAHVVEGEVASAVALAGEREHGVRAEPDLAVGPHRRVDAEKRERGIGNGIDEPADEVAPFRLEDEVVAAERDDPRLGRRAGERRDAIRVDTCADDHPVCLDLTDRGRHDRPARAADESRDRVPEERLAAPLAHVPGVFLGDAREVDDGGLRRVERPDAVHVGLELAEALAPDQLDTRHAVRERPAVQLVEPRELVVGGRDDHLAAAQDGNSPLLAVGEQACRPVDAEPRLERARRVVDAAVHDPTRATGLVAAHRRLLVEHRQPDSGGA